MKRCFWPESGAGRDNIGILVRSKYVFTGWLPAGYFRLVTSAFSNGFGVPRAESRPKHRNNTLGRRWSRSAQFIFPALRLNHGHGYSE